MPLELITMLVSTILGAILSLWSASIKAKHAQSSMLIETIAIQQKGFESAREFGKTDKHFAFTRRMIALSAIAAIIVLPKLAALFWPEMPIFYGYPEEVKDGWWIFATSMDQIQWKQMMGIVITPLDSHIVSAICGLYFGAAMVKN